MSVIWFLLIVPWASAMENAPIIAAAYADKATCVAAVNDPAIKDFLKEVDPSVQAQAVCVEAKKK